MSEIGSPLPKRPRVQGFDYATAGFYFVTVVTNHRACILSTVVGSQTALSDLGQIVEEHLHRVPERFPHICVDSHVVMPNHVHVLLEFRPSIKPVNLSRVMNELKGKTTVRYNKLTNRTGTLWQYGFYDTVIRSDRQLFATRKYIADNPIKWALDELNPNRDDHGD